MREMNRWYGTRSFVACAIVGLVVSAFGARAGATPQTQQTTTEHKAFEIVSVDGNKVVVKDAQGARELTVPNDFKVDVGGKMVGISELKPGMKGTATITTTTTEHKVYVSELKQARIHQIVGGNIIVMMKGDTSYKMFTQADAEKAGRHVMQNGKPLDWQTLRVGDTLSATIITEGPPQVLTEKQVEVKMAEAAKAAPPPAAHPAPPPTNVGTSAPPPAGSSAPLAPAPAPASAKKPAAAAPAPAAAPPPDSGATREPPPAPSAVPTPADTPAADQPADSTWNPLLIGGIVVALIVVGVLFMTMRRKEDEPKKTGGSI